MALKAAGLDVVAQLAILAGNLVYLVKSGRYLTYLHQCNAAILTRDTAGARVAHPSVFPGSLPMAIQDASSFFPAVEDPRWRRSLAGSKWKWNDRPARAAKAPHIFPCQTWLPNGRKQARRWWYAKEKKSPFIEAALDRARWSG
jgi:hypothetical protein